jgi:hypothetical protein
VLQVEEEARQARAAAGKPAGAWRSGRRRCDVERASGPGQWRAQRWRARGVEKSGAGQLGLEKWPAKAAGSRAQGRVGGTRGRRRRTGLEFSKNAGTPM